MRTVWKEERYISPATREVLEMLKWLLAGSLVAAGFTLWFWWGLF